MTIIVIRHQTGSKANQTEQLQLADRTEVSIGRDPTCDIKLDATKDEMASRRHCVIRIVRREPLTLELADLDSRNGTLLDGARLNAASPLQAGQVIQIGEGGPKFEFDLEPRPAHMMAPQTRMYQAPQATTQMRLGGAAAPAADSTASTAKPRIGAETVQRLLGAEREKHGRTLGMALAGVAVVVLIVGAGLYFAGDRQARAVESLAASGAAAAREDVGRLKTSIGMSAQDIAAKYRDANVMINASWRLIDKSSGQIVYQQVLATPDGAKYPAYVKMSDGSYKRWLTLDSGGGVNFPIGGGGQGSGFVVSENGFILTNKHVAAGWEIMHDMDLSFGGGVVVDGRGRIKGLSQDELRQEVLSSLPVWIPSSGGEVFEFRRGAPQSIGNRAFDGRVDELSVKFPGSANSFEASLVRSSQEADAALIKADVPQRLTPIPLADPKAEPAVGSRMYVMGYPAVSQRSTVYLMTQEGGAVNQRQETVADPTITEGIIGNITRGLRQLDNSGGAVRVSTNELGYSYEVSVNTTGKGNSGGPVLDAQGRVIGIFTYGWERAAAATSFAIPITYGIDLLGPRRVMN